MSIPLHRAPNDVKKIIFILALLTAVVLLFYPYLDDSDKSVPLTGLPWQIEVLPDGTTQVFGLQIGKSRLLDAMGILGEDMDVAIVAANEEVGNLEMYYGHYRAGLLSGKLLLQTSSDEENIKNWREHAKKAEHMASGQAKKYKLSADDLTLALKEVITGVTFIPAVNLDDEIIRARFGEPEMRVEIDGAIHYQYPAKGLDIAVFEKAKEVIQYVAPRDFKSIEGANKP